VAAAISAILLIGTSVACAATEAVTQQLSSVRDPGTSESAAVTSSSGVTEATMGVSAQGPELEVQERLQLAYPAVDVERSPDRWSRATDGNTSEWPEMRYLGEPRQIGNVTLTPQEIRIVTGRSIPMLYRPEHDEMVDAPTGSPSWVRGQMDRPGLVMAPNASLVMVRIETDPDLGDHRWLGGLVFVCGEDEVPPSEYAYNDGFYRISYPGLGETPLIEGSAEFSFGEYQGIGDSFCPESGWMYFVIPGVEVDPSLLWLEYVAGTEPGKLAFWTLAERP
jgi:hypothetical protein